MVRDVGVHRANHAQIVGVFGDAGKQLANLDAALAVLLERERRAKGRAGLALGREVQRNGLAVVLGELGLRVERVDLRRTTVHKQKNHALGLGGQVETSSAPSCSRRKNYPPAPIMGSPISPVIGGQGVISGSLCVALSHEAREAQAREAAAHLGEQGAAREKQVL